MKFSVYAAPGACVNWPGVRVIGAPCRYIGRYTVAGSKESGAAASFPAKKEAETVNADGDATLELHLKRKLQHGDLLPADKATADAAGVPFVELAQDADGDWRPKSKTKSQGTAPKE